LETMYGEGSLVAALVPPGNVAAEASEYRRTLFQALGSPAAFPFPCAAPIAPLGGLPSFGELAALAREAPRVYDRLAAFDGFVFLAPEPVLQPSPKPAPPPPEASRTPHLPCGRGFPLAFFEDEGDARKARDGLPPPPRLAVRTFQASVFNVRWSRPWHHGLVWETLASLRYPIRILDAS